MFHISERLFSGKRIAVGISMTVEITPELVRHEFPQRDDIVYLNHAGTAPWPRRTAEAVKRFAEENLVQGALQYPEWLRVESELRQHLRQVINAPSTDDIALVKNTSEALSMVAYGLDWRDGDNVVISNQEFPSNRIVWESLARFGVEVRQADLYGADTPEDALLRLVDERTRLLSISSIQYASGLRMDLKRLGDFCRGNDVLFCVDAIQSIGAVRLDVQAIKADFVMADGHKWMLGPEGVAVFYCRAELRDGLRLNQYGWHMVEGHHNFDAVHWEPARSARRFECGSPNMLGIHAFNASLSLLLEIGIDFIERNVIKNASYLIDLLSSHSSIELLTPSGPDRFGGIVVFRDSQVNSTRLFTYLREKGVICAQRGGGIRFSPHFYTPQESLARAMNRVFELT